MIEQMENKIVLALSQVVYAFLTPLRIWYKIHLSLMEDSLTKTMDAKAIMVVEFLFILLVWIIISLP